MPRPPGHARRSHGTKEAAPCLPWRASAADFRKRTDDPLPIRRCCASRRSSRRRHPARAESYVPLVPTGSNFKVTLQIEYTDEAERKRMRACSRRRGAHLVRVDGFDPVFAIADEDWSAKTRKRPRRCIPAFRMNRPWSLPPNAARNCPPESITRTTRLHRAVARARARFAGDRFGLTWLGLTRIN